MQEIIASEETVGARNALERTDHADGASLCKRIKILECVVFPSCTLKAALHRHLFLDLFLWTSSLRQQVIVTRVLVYFASNGTDGTSETRSQEGM